MTNLLNSNVEDNISSLPLDNINNLSEDQKTKIIQDASITQSIFIPSLSKESKEDTFFNKKTKSAAFAIIIYIILNTPIIQSRISNYYFKSQIINKSILIFISLSIAYLYYKYL